MLPSQEKKKSKIPTSHTHTRIQLGSLTTKAFQSMQADNDLIDKKIEPRVCGRNNFFRVECPSKMSHFEVSPLPLSRGKADGLVRKLFIGTRMTTDMVLFLFLLLLLLLLLFSSSPRLVVPLFIHSSSFLLCHGAVLEELFEEAKCVRNKNSFR
jgi:hypothetical protein